MFLDRTVFVIGAGASRELGLPVGDTLMDQIVASLAPDNGNFGFGTQRIVEALTHKLLKEHGPNWFPHVADYRNAAEKITRAMPFSRSIDTYLESQQDDQHVVHLGKLAICHCILDAESQSHLSGGDRHQVRKREGLSQSWYAPLGRILTAGHRPSDITNLFENVSFVVFNYDRCLEVYLERLVNDYFDVDGATATATLRSAEIVHAYGQVGKMAWQTEQDEQQDAVLFGGISPFMDPDPNIDRLSEQIRTYTETTDSQTGMRIKRLMSEADTVVFVGFGFINQNMKLIKPYRNAPVKRIFGTTFGFSRDDQKAISLKVLQAFGHEDDFARRNGGFDRTRTYEENLASVTCRQFMDNNVFSLADQ